MTRAKHSRRHRCGGVLPTAGPEGTFSAMFRRIARVLLVGFCVTIVAQQTNLGSLVFGDECRDNCPDDAASHRCPLNCTSCTCVGHGTPVSLALPMSAAVRPAVARVQNDEPKTLPDPQPDSIFHVPRPILV